MILGIAASISIATPIGVFKKWGDISVRNIAIPIDTGMAIERASIVVTSVPYKLAAAPKPPLQDPSQQ